MAFEYSRYYRILFARASLLTTVGVGLLLFNLVLLLSRKERILSFLLLLLAGSVTFLNGFFQFRHGVYLINEKETDKIVSVGEITDVERTYGSDMVFLPTKYGSTRYVFIDGERYYIWRIGELEVGDEVQFEYLPKSRIILSIEEVDNAE